VLIAEQWFPNTRLPIVVEAVGIGGIFRLSPRRILDVKINRRRNPVSAQAQFAVQPLRCMLLAPASNSSRFSTPNETCMKVGFSVLAQKMLWWSERPSARRKMPRPRATSVTRNFSRFL
jgi:hypothetical protein